MTLYVPAAVCCVGARHNCSPLLTARNLQQLQQGTRAEGTNMGSWLGYSWRRVSTILYYENVCHIATAALQPCRPHTDCRMCWYCSSNCTRCTTDCSTADGKLVQDGATEPNWATVNISSLHFYISTHRLLMLLSRLTMSLHPVLSVRHQPLSMLSPDWKLGFRFPLPAMHLAITSGFCHGW